MYKVTVSGKGQIALPAELRRRYDLKKGDKLMIRETGESLVLYPVPDQPLLQLRGRYKDEGAPTLTADLLEERKADRERDR